MVSKCTCFLVTGKHPWHDFTSSLAALFHVATSNEVPPLPSHISPTLNEFMLRYPSARFFIPVYFFFADFHSP